MFPQGRTSRKPAGHPAFYDSVPSRSAVNPVIETIRSLQKFQASSIVIQTALSQLRCHAGLFQLTHRVHAWKSKPVVAASTRNVFLLRRAKSKVVLQTLRIPGARLWAPETPNLYVLESKHFGGRFHDHSFWNARIALRHCNSTRLPQWPFYFPASVPTSLAPVFSKIPFPALWPGMLPGCANCSWIFLTKCTGTVSGFCIGPRA